MLSNPDACPANKEGAYGDRILCIYASAGNGDDAIAQIKYYIDTRSAKINSLDLLVAANGKIIFDAKVSGTGVQEMDVCYGPEISDKAQECPADNKVPGWIRRKERVGVVTLSDLDSQESYKVKVKLLNTGNTEEWHELAGELKPSPIAGPLDTYDGQGGLLMYNCQSSPNAADGLLLAFAALLLIIMRKRPKLLFNKKPLLMLPLLFLIPAQESRAEFGAVSVGILGSMYRPNLDSEAGANSFYKCHFRGASNKDGVFKEEGPINPLMGFDINWHLWDGLRLGFGVGYTYVSGVGLEMDAQNKPMCDNPEINIPCRCICIRFVHSSPMSSIILLIIFPSFPMRGEL